jgi:hypothetical protein
MDATTSWAVAGVTTVLLLLAFSVWVYSRTGSSAR